MPRVTAIPYTSAVANIGVELILSFNGMYRRFSFMATSLLAWPNTVTRPQQGFHYRGQTSRISSTVLARPRHTVGGVPSKRLIRVSTVVIVREYHNQRCTSGLKGYANPPYSVWWLLWHFAADAFPPSLPAFHQGYTQSRGHRQAGDVAGFPFSRIFASTIVAAARRTLRFVVPLFSFFSFFHRSIRIDPSFDRNYVNLQIDTLIPNISIYVAATRCFWKQRSKHHSFVRSFDIKLTSEINFSFPSRRIFRLL